MGEPVSPLGWTYVWRDAFGPGTVRGYTEFGGFSDGELNGTEDAYCIFGGYFYLNLSVMLVQMERMERGGAARTAAMFDGETTMPNFVDEDWHQNPDATARLNSNLGRFLAGEVHEDLDVIHDESIILRANRPDMAAQTNTELLNRLDTISPMIERAGCLHVQIGQVGMIAYGKLAELLASIDRNDLATDLSTGVQEVESADIASDLWELSRAAREDRKLLAALKASKFGDIQKDEFPAFFAKFDHFLFRHGCRSSNEWDVIYDTFETSPDLALALVKTMAKQGDYADPKIAIKQKQENRQRSLKSIAAHHPEEYPEIETFSNALATWLAARERSKNMCVRLVHEARVCFLELQSCGTATAALQDPMDFFMLKADELRAWSDDPSAFTQVLRKRSEQFATLHSLEPPFFVDRECPPLSDWDKSSEASEAPTPDNQALNGIACSAGETIGYARVLLDLSDPGAFQPGEILVTKITNPSWTPLFLVAGAVVTEFGLFNSHASIVSRELGIPCVASVPRATERIKDGCKLRVDGGSGVVEILEEAA